MCKITKERQNKVIEELAYYSKYDTVLTKTEWENFFEYLSDVENMNNSIEAFSSFDWARFCLKYMYSHVTDKGKVTSIDEVSLKDPFILQHFSYFKMIEDDFTHHLFMDNKPLCFIDVDNTLTNLNKISKEKKSFIANWKYKNNIILSSGKLPRSLELYQDELDIKGNYMSCLNGSVIGKNGEIYLINRIEDNIKPLLDKLKELCIHYVVYYTNSMSTDISLDSGEIDILKNINEYYMNKKDRKVINYNNVVKILMFVRNIKKNDEIINKLNEMLKEYPNLYMVRTGKDFLEIMSKKQDKGQTVKKICEEMGRYYRCSIGIGDSMNDLPMLDLVGRGYMVHNSEPELLKHSFEKLFNNRDKDIVILLKKLEADI